MLHFIKARIRHGYQAIPNPLTVGMDPAFPGVPELTASADLQMLGGLCPTNAFSSDGIDLGRCVFCGLCAREHPEMIKFTPNNKLAVDSRDKLIMAPGQKALPKIEFRLPFSLRRSFALRNVSAGGCIACEMELAASNNVNFDISRYGIDIVASPRHADALILTGPINRNMAEALSETWQAIPEPKYLILCGTCAISGGIFAGAEAINRAFLKHWAACLFIPGCPAHPLSIVHAIASIMGRR
ncbi:MAG TPA: NADH:ubiquinone oxidoreductase [Candidatus Cloacimonas sp.]|nr:NADH:ubiquinone oxidoreductase [Candidatus Cloacimonas sp.]